jgi:hypothetical protein
MAVLAGADDAPSTTAQLVFDEETKPSSVAWKRGEDEAVTVRYLDADELEVDVPVGEGCLVLLRSDALPILDSRVVQGGTPVEMTGLDWQEGARFSGRVVGVDDLPVPAVVRFEAQAVVGTEIGETCLAALAELDFFEIHASNTGDFESPPLPPGRYALSIEAPDHARAEQLLVLVKQDRHDLGAIELAAMARLEVALDAAEIEESPPFELVVKAERPEELKQRDRWQQVFQIEISPDEPATADLHPGRHRLIVRKPNGSLHYMKQLELRPGWQIETLRPEPIHVEGRVTSRQDPVEGAEVKFMFQEVNTSTTSDINGRYAVRLWTPAHYGAIAKEPDGGMRFETLDLEKAERGEVYELDFDLGAATISGRVVSSVDGTPIEGAGLGLKREWGDRAMHHSATANADGSFAFEGIAEADKVTVTADAEGFLRRQQEIAFSGEDVSGIWIELERSPSIRGRVVGPAGEPVAGIAIEGCPNEIRGQCFARATSGADGSFKIDVVSGTVLFAKAAGYAIGWTLAVEDEENVIQLQALSAPTTMRILMPDGEPAAGSRVAFVADTGVSISSFVFFQHTIMNGFENRSGADGSFPVANLPPGVYQVFTSHEGALLPLGSVPVPSSGVVTLRMATPKNHLEDSQKVAEVSRRKNP